MKRISILGSTGSIGTQALDIIDHNREELQVAALSCAKRLDQLREQIARFSPEAVCVAEEEDARTLQAEFPDVEVFCGMEGLVSIASMEGCDMVLNSLLGMQGLEPTLAAAKAGKDIAFANKETLVAGGELVMKTVRENGVALLPVDSEHSAIFQSLQGRADNQIRRILLTASGGPFRGYTKEQLEEVTLEQALKHPNWSMGAKITIDSATMMNKGLEVIEAKWLFDVEPENIQVLVHPQSIVHSGVEFMDNSVLCQLGVPDMRIPISLALGYPERLDNPDRELDFFTEGSNLTFEKPDLETFKCLGLAFFAAGEGGSSPVVMNAANEVLVQRFLEGRIGFLEMQDKLWDTVHAHKAVKDLTLEDILSIDKETRERV